MLFCELRFFIFFAFVFGFYKLLGRVHRAQNLFLIVASYLFYGAWDFRFLFLVIVSTVMDYTAALIMDRGTIEKRDRLISSAFLFLSGIIFLYLPFKSMVAAVFGMEEWSKIFDTIRQPGQLVYLALVVFAVFWVNFIVFVFHHIRENIRRKLALAMSIGANLLLLGFFKYCNFFVDNFETVMNAIFGTSMSLTHLHVILPVGISFYTFQSMGYTIDVYRGTVKAVSSLTNFAAFVSFFPQLVAGPISRAGSLLPQIENPRPPLTSEATREGLWLFMWGLYKKVVIADNLGVFVDQVFGWYHGGGAFVPMGNGLTHLFAVYAFAFQIYCDFSGYSDMARGVAKLLGVDLMVNFAFPYFSASPAEFWRRWHISLSSWLRDYLYIPLGGNRGSSLATYRNLFLTMLIGGLWHGASWTFVAWGAYHGILLIVYRLLGDQKKTALDLGLSPWTFVQIIVMFHLTCLGWLFFRAQSFSVVTVFLQSIFLGQGTGETLLPASNIVWSVVFLMAFEYCCARKNSISLFLNWPQFARLNVWLFITLSILGLQVGRREFIYFNF